MASQETSALFPLGELMRLEQNRIADEENRKTARAVAEEHARRVADRACREQERARIQREEDRRRIEVVREREQAVRLEAIGQAEIVRVRVEAEQRARLEALAAQHRHEQKLAALETDAGKKRLSRTLRWTLGVSVALLVGGVGLYVGRVRPEARSQVQSLQSLILGQRQQTEATQRALDAQNQKIGDLEDRVRKEREEGERLRLENESKSKAAPPPVSSRRGVRPVVAPVPCVCVDPHDPLCGCLKG